MKVIFVFFALVGLPLTPVMAQKTPSTTTEPRSTTVVTNRQQELYDHYHSYSKKTGADPTPAPTQRPDSEQPNPEPAVSTAPTIGRKDNQPVPPMASADPLAPTGNTFSRIRIGARGGLTYPIFLASSTILKPAVSFVGGIVLTVGRGAISFQPEVNYARHSVKSGDSYGTYVSARDILEVPLFVKFSTGSYAGTRFFVNVGPYVSYIASTSFEGKKIPPSSLGISNAGRYGFGAALGVGLSLKAGPGHATIEVRGLYSLGDADNGFSTDTKTILGEGTIGYIFPLGKGR